MQGYGVPGSLDSRVGHAVMFEELADGVRAVHLKAIGLAAELFQQAKVMEGGADKEKLDVEFFPGLPAELIGPEEDAVRVVDEQRRAEFPEKSGRLASQLSVPPASTV
jgi:hypothetical protein